MGPGLGRQALMVRGGGVCLTLLWAGLPLTGSDHMQVWTRASCRDRSTEENGAYARFPRRSRLLRFGHPTAPLECYLFGCRWLDSPTSTTVDPPAAIALASRMASGLTKGRVIINLVRGVGKMPQSVANPHQVMRT